MSLCTIDCINIREYKSARSFVIILLVPAKYLFSIMKLTWSSHDSVFLTQPFSFYLFTDDSQSRCATGNSNIHIACENGDIAAVKDLLCWGVSIEERDSQNQTLLHAACVGGHIDLVSLLLELGADVNAVDTWGSTALLKACLAIRDDIASLLIQHGADVHVTNDSNDTALHQVCQSEYYQCLAMSPDSEDDSTEFLNDNPPSNNISPSSEKHHFFVVRP